MSLNPQLQKLIDEFNRATQRLHRLVETVPEPFWSRRPAPERWSMSECVAHLNLTSNAYLPIVRDGLDRAARIGPAKQRRYRRDFAGWLLWKVVGPPARIRVKTTAPFVPSSTTSVHELVDEFDRLNEKQIQFVREADGLPLREVQITSPFSERMKYNLFSCLSILPRHEHRHLWQAEQAWKRLEPEPRNRKF